MVVTRGQTRKALQHPVTEDGGNLKLMIDVKEEERSGEEVCQGKEKDKGSDN